MMAVLVGMGCLAATAQDGVRRSDWHGYERLDFAVDDHEALLVLPKDAAGGRPWVWRMRFFGHEPQADVALLGKGLHVAYIDLGGLFGGPEAMRRMDAFYAYLTQQHGLADKVVLEGFSRGGLPAFNWAARNPDKIACVYVDAPVCDIRSWPAGLGNGTGNAPEWDACKQVYGLTDETASEFAGNPIDHLGPLAEAGIPILSICGETDTGVPLAENTRVVEERYRALGGDITVIAKPHNEHHPHSMQDPTRIVNWVLGHTGLKDALLPEAQTPYGYDYFETRGGLANCRLIFEREKRGRVVFLGGSITAGGAWRDMVCEELQRRFPETEFDFINAGIPSFGSTPGAFRFERDVLSHGKVDLLFQEAAVNDSVNGRGDPEPLRGMEGVVRQARLASPDTDIVLLHFADPGKLAEYDAGRVPEVIARHEEVASHYNVPSIDLAKEVTERIHAREFTWEDDIKDLHPSPFGHGVYFRSVCRLLDAAWAEAPAEGAEVQAYPLPEPLDEKSYFRGRLVSIEEAELISGWRIDPKWRASDGAPSRINDEPMLIAEEPGARLRLRFEGTAVGMYLAAGPDAGTLAYRIDGGEPQARDLFTAWSGGLHLNWVQVLAADLEPGEHVLEVRMSEQANANSKGHAARVAWFVAN